MSLRMGVIIANEYCYWGLYTNYGLRSGCPIGPSLPIARPGIFAGFAAPDISESKPPRVLSSVALFASRVRDRAILDLCTAGFARKRTDGAYGLTSRACAVSQSAPLPGPRRLPQSRTL